MGGLRETRESLVGISHRDYICAASSLYDRVQSM